MPIWVYAIKSLRDGRTYVGQTKNIENRLKQHNGGLTRSTRYYKPWKLFYSKYCLSRKKARQFEKYLKSGCGKEFLKTICARSSIG